MKAELLKLFGNMRIRNENPYEIYDLYNVEMNYQEIGILFFFLSIEKNLYQRMKKKIIFSYSEGI